MLCGAAHRLQPTTSAHCLSHIPWPPCPHASAHSPPPPHTDIPSAPMQQTAHCNSLHLPSPLQRGGVCGGGGVRPRMAPQAAARGQHTGCWEHAHAAGPTHHHTPPHPLRRHLHHLGTDIDWWVGPLGWSGQVRGVAAGRQESSSLDQQRSQRCTGRVQSEHTHTMHT